MDEKKITNISMDSILPNRMQPRVVFQDDAIDELAESIKKHGIINPITVRRLGNKYEIIAGERRFKASQSIGLKEIPAIVIDADDKKTAELALIENIQRKELSPIEEGMSYEKILQIGDITQAELSKQLGKKQSTIANKIRLLKLDDSVKEALLNEKISERHARSLLKLYDKKDQARMLEKIIRDRLTVRQTDKEIEKIVEEKGEMIEMDNNFNMPNSNLILDKEKEEIKEPGKEINPSFVDVNKIEEKSEDLFKEKPTVNIEDLLKTPPKTENVEEKVEPPVTEEPKDEEKNEEPPMGHKFFSIFPPEEEQPTEEPKEKVQETIDFTPAEEPVKEEVKVPEMSFNINDIESFEPIKEEKEELPEVKVDNIEEPVKEEIDIIPEPIQSNVVEPPKEETSKETNEQEEYNFDNFNPIIHNDFAGEEIKDDDVEFIEEDEEEPKEQVKEQGPKQMKDVIRIIRDCNDIIESYGYKIETEEFDLETMYQVIFKIYKN